LGSATLVTALVFINAAHCLGGVLDSGHMAEEVWFRFDPVYRVGVSPIVGRP
jgi:hypothetical protein